MWNNQKQQKVGFLFVKLTDLLSFSTRFPKSGPTYRGQAVNPRYQTPQGQSFYVIPPHWHDTSICNPTSSKTSAYLFDKEIRRQDISKHDIYYVEPNKVGLRTLGFLINIFFSLKYGNVHDLVIAGVAYIYTCNLFSLSILIYLWIYKLQCVG